MFALKEPVELLKHVNVVFVYMNAKTCKHSEYIATHSN